MLRMKYSTSRGHFCPSVNRVLIPVWFLSVISQSAGLLAKLLLHWAVVHSINIIGIINIADVMITKYKLLLAATGRVPSYIPSCIPSCMPGYTPASYMNPSLVCTRATSWLCATLPEKTLAHDKRIFQSAL